MKIVFLNPTAQMGGAELSLLDLMFSVRASKPDWSLNLIAAGTGPLIEKAKEIGVKTFVMPFPEALARLGDAGAAAGAGATGKRCSYLSLLAKSLWVAPQSVFYRKRLEKALKKLGPDIVHTNGLKMHLLGAWSSPRQTPVIWHMHDYLSARPFMCRALQTQVKRCAAVITNSESVAEDVRFVFSDSVKVQTVYNRIDIERFSPMGKRLDLDALSNLPIKEEVIRVGLPATFAFWKGQEIFLKAFSMLPSGLPIRGYIIGGAIYETLGSQYSIEELSAMVNDLNLENKVGLTGYVEDSAAAMRALDIVVHASTRPEPFGRVIIEAMACERAVIVSAAGGAKEIIDDGVNALSHQPGDAKELARQIEKLVKNKNLREKLGKRGRATAERCFDRKHISEDLVPIYQTVVH